MATAAALYWRVVGSGERAVDCLRHTLHHAPRHMKDIPLISLANILHRQVSFSYCCLKLVFTVNTNVMKALVSLQKNRIVSEMKN